MGTWGIAVDIGILMAALGFVRKAAKEGVSGEEALEAVLWALAFGVVGARLLFVVGNLKLFREHPLEAFMLWKGGLTIVGGIPFGILGVFLWSKVRGANFLKIMDIGAVWSTLGMAIGRIGCLLNGCCYGKPTSLPWGIEFPPDPRFPERPGVPLHPTQIYHSVANFLVFVAGYFLLSREKVPGRTFFSVLGLYCVGRFLVEIFRANQISFFGLTYAQWFSLIFGVASLVAVIYLGGYGSKGNNRRPCAGRREDRQGAGL